jgi:hypothetical protein
LERKKKTFRPERLETYDVWLPLMM